MREVTPLPEGCPWAGWMPPTVKWCEANLCDWITAPANTWSNLAFIFVAVPMFVYATRRVRLFGPAAVAVGVTSFAFHASYTFFFQFFDYVGMFIFIGLPVTMNLVRAGRLRAERAGRAYAVVILALCAVVPVFYFLHLPLQAIIALSVVGIIAQELMLPRVERRLWWVAMGFILTAATFSGLDAAGVMCAPDDHVLQGHAIWHVLAACSLLALFAFYRGLPEAEAEQLRAP